LNIAESTPIYFWARQARRDAALCLYATTMGFAASGAALVLLRSGYGLKNAWVTAILAVAAAAAERGTVRLNSKIEISIGLLPTLFAAVVLGPLAAMSVSAASMLGDLRRRPSVSMPHLRWLVYTSTRALTGAAAGMGALALSDYFSNQVVVLFAATGVGAVTLECLDTVFFSSTMWLRRNDVVEALKAVVPIKLMALPLFTPVVGLLASTYEYISLWTLPLFLVPAFAAHRFSTLYQDQRRLTEDLTVANVRLEHANLSFAAAMVATLDARDQYTAGHSTAVAAYASEIAAWMGLTDEEQQLVYLSGLVHDVGKVGLPVGLLEKPGSLTLAEREQMEEHAAIGEMILAKVDNYGDIARVVRHHHERIDGRGYPDGLSGEDIPLSSRIIAVADAYDAMTSDRPYRNAMDSRVARLRLAHAVGTQFDTSIVAAFEAILTDQEQAADSLAYRELQAPTHSVRVALQQHNAA
jgi:putative nucleotidyltransferase with HDIG domain